MDPRDPKRIPRILADIEDVWKEHPDVRLMQLLSQAVDVNDQKLYFVEDDDLIVMLRDYYEIQEDQ